jgi:DNA modification methylase
MKLHTIIPGDCLQSMRMYVGDGEIQTCVTSPPYFGLRDYGNESQIGKEATLNAYVEKMVEVFSEVRRCLNKEGTLWLNLGDTYSSGARTTQVRDSFRDAASGKQDYLNGTAVRAGRQEGIKEKDLMGVPWRVAFALQADGWYLRQDIIWSKPNPMPESIKDRCTKAHEYIFLLSKSKRYYFDSDAMQEPAVGKASWNKKEHAIPDGHSTGIRAGIHKIEAADFRNRRSVWTITTKPFKGAHFATFPPEIPELCILAGSRPGDTVLDPFGGAGTTALVANRLGRPSILCELNPEYIDIAEKRLADAG